MKRQETTDRLEGILKKVRTEKDVRSFMESHTGREYDSFPEYFNDHIAHCGMTVPEIIERSNISRNYVYNILNGNRKPGRDKIIALGIGSGMTFDEINRGLKIAKEGILYAKDERDARIMIAVNNGVRSVTELNIMLESEGLPIIE